MSALRALRGLLYGIAFIAVLPLVLIARVIVIIVRKF